MDSVQSDNNGDLIVISSIIDTNATSVLENFLRLILSLAGLSLTPAQGPS